MAEHLLWVKFQHYCAHLHLAKWSMVRYTTRVFLMCSIFFITAVLQLCSCLCIFPQNVPTVIMACHDACTIIHVIMAISYITGPFHQNLWSQFQI